MDLHAIVSPRSPPLLPLSSSSSAATASSVYYLRLGLRRPPALMGRAALSARCSVSQVHSYGTVDYERRPARKWSSLYRRISTMGDPAAGPAGELERWEAEERRLSKWDLCRVAKELRKFRRFKLALEVYDWITAQGDRFTLSSSDMAIRLDLIAKVHGIPCAEEHFSMLPDSMKDKRTYGALLNVYGQARMKDKAEAIIEIMKKKGYTTDALPFNVMMTLYMNIGDHEKVNMIINEMREKNIRFDIFSYNIWITNCAAMEDSEEMEQVVNLMTADSTINANWTTYTTLASMYIKLGNVEKAQDYLKDAEIRITGRDRTSFNYLLGLYGTIGKRDEVYRIWNWYKSSFSSILNLGYQAMLSSLVRLGDIEGAEMIYEEWLSTTEHFDPRNCNILMGWYVREGLLMKARSVLDRMIGRGGKPKSATWEILAEGYISEKQISEALSCLKEAAWCPGVTNWRPKPVNIANILELSKELNNMEAVRVVTDVLRNLGCIEREEYKTQLDAYPNAVVHARG